MTDVESFAKAAGIEVFAGPHLAAVQTGDFRRDPTIDYGRVVQKLPSALLRPRDREQLSTCLRFLSATRTPFVIRGSGHSSGGQPLIADGVVVDLRYLDRIVEDAPASETITVEGGTFWSAVARHLHAQGRRPTSVTANLRSTVAGTLAVGGFGDAAHLHGLQIDHVSRLTVCTPDGALHRVGPEDELFRWTLAGRGQLAVIVDATLQTMRRPWVMTGRALAWTTLADYVRDAERIAERGLYDFMRARIHIQGTGVSMVTAHVGRTSTVLDDPAAVELSPAQASAPELVDLYALLMREPLAEPRLACPALELVLPMSNAVAAWDELRPMVAAAGIPALQPAGHSVMIVARGTLPLAPLPANRSMMIALRPKLPVAAAPALLPALRAIGRRALDHGAKLYLMSIDVEDPHFADRQFGAELVTLRRLKAHFDPHGLLNPGLL